MIRSDELASLSAAKRELLARLLTGEAGSGAPDPDRVTQRPAGTTPPISAEQTQVWLHAALAGELPLYNEPITIHRRGALDLGLLEDSLNELLQRHEIWRTAFELVDGQVRQRIEPALRITLPLVDLSRLPAAEREAEALRLATEAARSPFDLGRAPLLRAQVLKLADDEHRLHLTLHHLIFDGVSFYRTVMPELTAIYDALANGRAPDLPPPELQYGDYALWRERTLAGDALAPQLAYWKQQLAGELPTVQLPTDHPRPAQLGHRGSMEMFALTPELTRALNALSRAEGATLYMVLLAAFKSLLHRYGGQEDLVVGGLVDMRRRPELERVIGYFLNSVVLRTRPTSQMRFRDYLAQVRSTVVGALAASDVPFARIVRELRPSRDPSAHPLFQVLFSIQPPMAAFASGWDLTQMDVTVGTAKFDLYLELEERPDRIVGRFLYSTELFEPATIRRMIDHWIRVLEAITADPTQHLGALPMLSDREQEQLLVAWNQTQRAIPPTTVQDWIAQQAKRRPEATAVRCGAISCSYRALDRRAEEIAAHLRAAGVGPGTVIGICVERTPELVAGLLGILKTGGAYLPLDPAFPKARLDLILTDAAPLVCLTERSLAASLPVMPARILLLENCLGPARAAPAPATTVGLDDLAYVLYTSGSTGRPKGVEVPHRALVNLLAAMQMQPGFGEDDTLLSVTTVSFDIAALELFLPLVSGGTVLLADPNTASDPHLLARLIDRARCDVLQATPATWQSLLDTGWQGAPQLRMLCGGEALPRPLAERLLAHGADLWNLYGPTETTIWSTVHKVESGTGPVAIGRPIANTQLYILDAQGQILPVGAAGELHIGGAGVARGYRHRDALTRERFVTASVAPGGRLYRTGDLARYRDDGTVEWLGRLDHQVKVRGFRVELEEIEAALLHHDAIAAAAVRTWPDASGVASLAAYVVARNGAAPEPAALRAFLRQSLPDYMIPLQLVALPRLPMTPNGKVDRNALPRPETERRPASVAEWRDATEQQLAALWMDVLGVAQLGAEEDFFQLGGHSLLAAQMLGRVDQAFGISLPIAAVFRAPTVRHMAAMLRERPGTARPGKARPAQPEGWRGGLSWLHRTGVRSLGARLGRVPVRAPPE